MEVRSRDDFFTGTFKICKYILHRIRSHVSLRKAHLPTRKRASNTVCRLHCEKDECASFADMCPLARKAGSRRNCRALDINLYTIITDHPNSELRNESVKAPLCMITPPRIASSVDKLHFSFAVRPICHTLSRPRQQQTKQ